MAQPNTNTQPANLTLAVQANPPSAIVSITDPFEYSIALRHAIFGAARHLHEQLCCLVVVVVELIEGLARVNRLVPDATLLVNFVLVVIRLVLMI